jgi:hypothetical protein
MDVKLKDEGQSARYLLGKMTDAEQARFEESVFHDVELSELVSDVENDLIDGYVRGELSPRERERFEHHFLVSDRRREKLEVARALLQAKDARAASRVVDSPAPFPWWNAVFASLRLPSTALSYSFGAAAVLFLLGGLWLFSEVRQLRKETARLAAERNMQSAQNDELREQANEQHRHSEEVASQKEQLEQQLAELRNQAGTRGREPSAASALLTFILSPVSRGTEAPKKLIIPSEISSVRLQLNLSPGDEYPAYQVNLQRANGRQVRTFKGLRAASAKGTHAVFVDVQANSLGAGEYEVTLSGVAKGKIETIGYYYFSLMKD